MLTHERYAAAKELHSQLLVLDKIYESFQEAADFELKLDQRCGQGWSPFGGVDVLLCEDRSNPYETRSAHMCYTKCLIFLEGNWAWALAYGGRSWGRLGTNAKSELALIKVEIPSTDRAEIGKEIATNIKENAASQRFSIVAENKRGQYYVPENSQYHHYITEGLLDLHSPQLVTRIIDSTKSLMSK